MENPIDELNKILNPELAAIQKVFPGAELMPPEKPKKKPIVEKHKKNVK